jgi:hypothetical protein
MVSRVIMDAYIAQNMTFKEIRTAAGDPLREFSEACREELLIFDKR